MQTNGDSVFTHHSRRINTDPEQVPRNIREPFDINSLISSMLITGTVILSKTSLGCVNDSSRARNNESDEIDVTFSLGNGSGVCSSTTTLFMWLRVASIWWSNKGSLLDWLWLIKRPDARTTDAVWATAAERESAAIDIAVLTIKDINRNLKL